VFSEHQQNDNRFMETCCLLEGFFRTIF